MLYGVYKHLLTSVLVMLYIHFCHCKQLNHQEYVGYVCKAVLAQIYSWDFLHPVPLLAHLEAIPTSLGGSPRAAPQGASSHITSGTGAALAAMTIKLALNPSRQPSEGMGGMFSMPLEWFEGPLQGKASRTEGLAPQERCGRNC